MDLAVRMATQHSARPLGADRFFDERAHSVGFPGVWNRAHEVTSRHQSWDCESKCVCRHIIQRIEATIVDLLHSAGCAEGDYA
jgi:hypothetical protein